MIELCNTHTILFHTSYTILLSISKPWKKSNKWAKALSHANGASATSTHASAHTHKKSIHHLQFPLFPYYKLNWKWWVQKEALLFLEAEIITFSPLQFNATVTALSTSPCDLSATLHLLQCYPLAFFSLIPTALLCNSINLHCCCTVHKSHFLIGFNAVVQLCVDQQSSNWRVETALTHSVVCLHPTCVRGSNVCMRASYINSFNWPIKFNNNTQEVVLMMNVLIRDFQEPVGCLSAPLWFCT